MLAAMSATKSRKPTMPEVIEGVFREIGAIDNHPKHVGEFGPIVAARWKALGHPITKNIDRQINAALQSWSLDSKEGQKQKNVNNPNSFKMHKEGYWSLRPGPDLEDL
jgi:hypothetical protein